MAATLWTQIKCAYQMVGEHTPVRADCGELCGAACCEGDDEIGMLLFPGEAARLAKVPGFRVHRIDYMDGKAWLLTCDGTCDRSRRPLSCRIFPLVPVLDAQGRVEVVPDPRARRMCPLADGAMLDRRFRRAVAKAMTHLAADPRMGPFLRMLSDEIGEITEMQEQFRSSGKGN